MQQIAPTILRLLRNHGELLLVFFVIAVSAAATFYVIHDETLYVDEYAHFWEIKELYGGNWEAIHKNPALPGYYLWIAGLFHTFGVDVTNPTNVRWVSLLTALALCAVFYGCARRLDQPRSAARTLDFYLLPILFPHLFLIYTDPLAIALLLAGAWAMFARNWSLAGVFGALSVFTRQINIVWLAFLVALPYLEANRKLFDPRAILQHLFKNRVFVFTVIGFVLFVIINGGVAMRDTQIANPITMRIENLYFCLLTLFILFLPWHLANVSAIIDLLRRHRWVVLVCIAAFVLYFIAFKGDHRFNSYPHYYLSNVALREIRSSAILKTLVFIPMIWTGLSLAVTPLLRRSHYWLYGFWAISLIPSWMVTTRYYIVGVAFLLLFRAPTSKTSEWILAGYWLMGTMVLIYLVVSRLAWP